MIIQFDWTILLLLCLVVHACDDIIHKSLFNCKQLIGGPLNDKFSDTATHLAHAYLTSQDEFHFI